MRERKSAVLNLSIELNDFWSGDEDTMLEESLRNAIVGEVNKVLRERVAESINRLVQEEFGDKLRATLSGMIAGKIEAIMLTESITVYNQEVKIIDHVKRLFMDKHREWDDTERVIRQQAKKWADDLKARYDIAFANQLVQKLNENGLLLPDVAKRLLG